MLNEENSSKLLDSPNQLNLSLEGYEGPIDLLLDLAKKQKVNLSNISVLELAEQYIKFIHKFKELHLEIAADYLVMASWLTYLKSRLLLPKDEEENEHTPEQLEAAIKYQLQRLEAMQNSANILYSRPLIGRDIFYRGLNNSIKINYQIEYISKLYDLLKTYALIISKKNNSSLTITSSDLFSVEEALKRLTNIFLSIDEWTNFINFLPEFKKNDIFNKSAVSSNFVASLQLVKNDFIEMKQNEVFGNIFIRLKNNE